MAKPPMLKADGRVSGEPLVWLTGMGLSLALAMVAGLLLLIIGNGIAVFWPKRVAAWQVDAGDGKAETLLAKEVNRRIRAAPGKEPVEEVQVFSGNKDVWQIGFRWLDAPAIRSTSFPEGVIEIERTEYGDAIGFPVEIRAKDQPALPATAAGFDARLAALTAEVGERRARIFHLERRVIGANARRIADLERTARLAEKRGDAARAAEARTEGAGLKKEYEDLAAQARELRQAQRQAQLVLRLADGRQRVIPFESVVDAWYPNRDGFAARVGRFIAGIWSFLSENPREANTEGGIFPAIFGTFVMTLLMSLAVTPFGVLAAIYLREYARQGPFVRGVRIAVNNLAGVPSIVFGVFGLGFFVYAVGGTLDDLFFPEYLPTPVFGTGGVMWSAATLALMTVPVVIVATEEAVAAVPRGAREGSLALGASKWQTIQRIVLPAAVPGILTGLILAMARGAGEVAPLMLVGVVKLAPNLPVDGNWYATDILPFIHLDQKFMHLGFHIYDLGFQSPDSEAAKPMVFATTLLLISLVLALNLGAIWMRERLRRRFATSAF